MPKSKDKHVKISPEMHRKALAFAEKRGMKMKSLAEMALDAYIKAAK